MAVNSDSRPGEILGYWFSGDPKEDFKKWFSSGQQYDAPITAAFSTLLQEAEKGHLAHWANGSRSFLAHILLLDQFSRHIYRGTPEAYKNDTHALTFMESAIMDHLDSYTAAEKMFALMPYQHSEKIEDQKKGRALLRMLTTKEGDPQEKNRERQKKSKPVTETDQMSIQMQATDLKNTQKLTLPKKTLDAALHHQKGYHDIIQRFGRFPRRNAILGRESAEEEKAYIATSSNVPY